jgi:benzodiazapine receptor
MNRPSLPTLLAFLLLVVGGGLALGAFNIPGGWYEALEKPWFNPPNWLFGPAWTTLYVLIAIAGARSFARDRGSPAMKAWWAQLAFNFLWSPVFFTLHAVGAALVVVVAMLVSILAFILLTRRVDLLSALLFVPYLLWVSFATALNAAILWLN